MNISNSFMINQQEENKVALSFDNNQLNCDQLQSKAEHTTVYSCKDLVFELLCLHKCKYKPWERFVNRMKLFREQAESFNSDIDCLQIAKSVRELQELKQQIRETMQQNHQLLEIYQQSWYFDSSTLIESNINPQIQQFSAESNIED